MAVRLKMNFGIYLTGLHLSNILDARNSKCQRQQRGFGRHENGNDKVCNLSFLIIAELCIQKNVLLLHIDSLKHSIGEILNGIPDFTYSPHKNAHHPFKPKRPLCIIGINNGKG